MTATKWLLYLLGVRTARQFRQCVLLFVALSHCPLSAGDWPRWRGPNLDGISRETGWSLDWPNGAPPQVWRANVSTGFSAVAVAQGRLFTLGNSNETDTVYCLDAETGRRLWSYSYPCPLDAIYYEGGPGSTPAVDGDRVHTLSKRGHLFAFEAGSGRVVWQKDLLAELGAEKPRWGLAGSPLVHGELLILNVGSGGVAVRKATGDIAWKSGRGLAGYATPVPFGPPNQGALAIFAGKALVGVRARDGQELWRMPWETRWDINAADPVPVDNRLFISTFDRGCALVEVSSGSPRTVWANKNLANHFNGCLFWNGYLYGVHGNTDQAERDLRCLDPRTGEIKWKYPGLGLGSLTAADGKLIVLSDRGELVVADASPAGFKPRARAQVLGGKCWTPPVLANGRLYCRNATGTLVALDLRRRDSE